MSMYSLIEKMVQANSDIDLNLKFDEVIKIKKEFEQIAINNNVKMGPGVAGGSPCERDLLFWYLAARTFKPKRVLEIGSWIGTTTYVIAKALYEIYGDDFSIVTCDYPTDVYIREHNYKHLSKNIFYNNMHSDNLVPQLIQQNYKFDSIFSDAGLSDSNVNDFSSLIDFSNLLFLTHDVYVNKYSKGNDAIAKINSTYANLLTFKPDKEEGYIFNNINYPINAVTGIVTTEKKYESTF